MISAIHLLANRRNGVVWRTVSGSKFIVKPDMWEGVGSMLGLHKVNRILRHRVKTREDVFSDKDSRIPIHSEFPKPINAAQLLRRHQYEAREQQPPNQRILSNTSSDITSNPTADQFIKA